ncbi:MAG: hypothetical protein NTW14_01410 [bacterium]|nr:hypothetical protein [bacterium]
MGLTDREFWTALHGMFLGGGFLLSYSGMLVLLLLFRDEWLSAARLAEHLKYLRLTAVFSAVIAWAAVLVGDLVVMPWFEATPPPGADLAGYPKSFLEANAQLSWLPDAMDFKETVAWFVPILVSLAAIVIFKYGVRLSKSRRLRNWLAAGYSAAFVLAPYAL